MPKKIAPAKPAKGVKAAPKATKPRKSRKKANPQPAGRKTIPISVEELEKLAGLQCTYAEVAGWFGVSLNTIKRRLGQKVFRAAWDNGREKGKVSLRRNQFTLSGRNATMAIFLGKQWLGQRDVVANELSGPGGGPIAISDAKATLIRRIADLRNRFDSGRSGPENDG